MVPDVRYSGLGIEKEPQPHLLDFSSSRGVWLPSAAAPAIRTIGIIASRSSVSHRPGATAAARQAPLAAAAAVLQGRLLLGLGGDQLGQAGYGRSLEDADFRDVLT